jgi:riboflavin kinase, archaea type
MKKLIGKVITGSGDLSFRMNTVPNLMEAYYKKTGFRLFPGSLNIKMENDFQVPTGAMRLEKEEYGGQVSVSLIPCRFLDKDVFIVRTDKVERNEVPTHPKNIIEIISDVKLRDTFNLKDGDTVEITLV